MSSQSNEARDLSLFKSWKQELLPTVDSRESDLELALPVVDRVPVVERQRLGRHFVGVNHS